MSSITADPYAHLRDKLFAYANPSPGTASTRFYLRGDEVWTVNERGRQRAIQCANARELQTMISRGVLVVDEAEALASPRSSDAVGAVGGSNQ